MAVSSTAREKEAQSTKSSSLKLGSDVQIQSSVTDVRIAITLGFLSALRMNSSPWIVSAASAISLSPVICETRRAVSDRVNSSFGGVAQRQAMHSDAMQNEKFHEQQCFVRATDSVTFMLSSDGRNRVQGRLFRYRAAVR